MSIKDATPEEIQALKARFSKKQSDRLCEAQMDEVVRMVGKRPFRATQASQEPHRAIPVETAIVATGTAAIAGAAALLGSTGAVPMGYAAFVTGVALAGAVSEVARNV